MKQKNIEHLDIIKLCTNRGIHMTKQRRVIANIINKSKDHPDAEKIYFRSNKENKNISLATVYRTVKLFEDANIIIFVFLGGHMLNFLHFHLFFN
mgnify:CR=1 FL=1